MIPSLDAFSPLVGSKFIVETTAGPVELLLVEAKECPRKGLPEGFRTPLSLIFTSSPDLVLSQDTYYIDHPALGRNAWCIAPISSHATAYLSAVPLPAEKEQRYQILFT